eukprot:scaffold4783_cov373-Prasinococcus_capsulatus_cf.AAC.2
MGRRYIEVFASKKADYYAAVAEFMREGGAGGDKPDNPHDLAGGQHQPYGHQLNSTVGYSSSSSTQRVPQQHQPQQAQPQPQAPTQAPAQQHEGRERGGNKHKHTGVLRMRGLPFSCEREDILKFFQDYVRASPPATSSSSHLTEPSAPEPGARAHQVPRRWAGFRGGLRGVRRGGRGGVRPCSAWQQWEQQQQRRVGGERGGGGMRSDGSPAPLVRWHLTLRGALPLLRGGARPQLGAAPLGLPMEACCLRRGAAWCRVIAKLPREGYTGMNIWIDA